ncbi:uncharacterized protein PHACADRAFT_186151 [Phanerochaete carnosa HHB-10118-sp]|uniref:Uncharacterized protein n=1 Tax=Phanerochaete carnosa (strain HHB-10118-sp) TaxID=650164 RepID=K5W2Y1_PHACS|nr:uncharacterized protein PHACADRAFT_186151 [Phanerochaete carnosa HHB-10118-sp]EKM53485.1 hypothetical protein PHACADRAFT_186151 [Phanerochaete carnosa HHB-10118-sp]
MSAQNLAYRYEGRLVIVGFPSTYERAVGAACVSFPALAAESDALKFYATDDRFGRVMISPSAWDLHAHTLKPGQILDIELSRNRPGPQDKPQELHLQRHNIPRVVVIAPEANNPAPRSIRISMDPRYLIP